MKAVAAALGALNRGMWSVLMANAEGKADETIEGCSKGGRLWGQLRIPMWFC